MWTQFGDMNSGGDRKEDVDHIYIEAPEEEARVIFFNRFGHNADRVTCTCCGPDYSVIEEEDLAQLTGFNRGCLYVVPKRDPVTLRYDNDDPNSGYLEEGEEAPAGYEVREPLLGGQYRTLDQYKASGEALFIPASDIKLEERKKD